MMQPLKLYAKLLAASQRMKALPKSGRSADDGGYPYVEAGPVIAAARKELLSRGILIVPSASRSRVEDPGQGKYSRLTRIEVDYAVIDTESGEEFTSTWSGQGFDASDKGIYKAATGCLKYFLINLLMIPIGDDPEATASPKEKRRTKSNAEISAHLAKPGEVLASVPHGFDIRDAEMRMLEGRFRQLGLAGRGSGTPRAKLIKGILGRSVLKKDLTADDLRVLNVGTLAMLKEKLGPSLEHGSAVIEAPKAKADDAVGDANSLPAGNESGVITTGDVGEAAQGPVEPAPDSYREMLDAAGLDVAPDGRVVDASELEAAGEEVEA